MIILFGSSIAEGDIFEYIAQVVSCIPWWRVNYKGCSSLLLEGVLEYTLGLSLNKVREIQTIITCLPNFDMDNNCFEVFLTAWTPVLLVINLDSRKEDMTSQLLFLFTYLGWLGASARFIIQLGSMFETIRDMPPYIRRRSKPKFKMKRRPIYPFYKRKMHRKIARIKMKQSSCSDDWGSTHTYYCPLNKVLHKIGDTIANKWDKACDANPYLVDLARGVDLVQTTRSTRMINKFLFNIDGQVVDLTKITDTGQLFRSQAAYWLEGCEGERLIFDTGASVTITPHEKDFTSIDKSQEAIQNVTLQGITTKAAVKGVGKIRLLVYTDGGFARYIETEAYWVPHAKARLLSITNYVQETKGGAHFRCDENGSYFQFSNKLGGGKVTFDLKLNGNLPVASAQSQRSIEKDKKEKVYSVLGKQNINLTRSQQELLKTHFCLGHWNLQWIQGLMRKGILKHSDAATTKPEAICQCAACNFAKQTRRPEGTVKQSIRKEKDGNLKKNQLRVGGMVSSDQYVSSVHGRLPHTFGKEKKHEKYVGGSIFVDEASGFMYTQNQVSLGAAETIRAKHSFEREASRYGIPILGYRADNGVYKTKAFSDDLATMKQTIQFCGVGAHHHNGIAERAIRTVTTCARTMMIHAILHNHKEVNLDLWPFAMDYAVYLWNKLPKRDGSNSPEEIFYSTKSDYSAIREAKCWGCPAYVLDPKIQDGKKLPRWSPRSKLGQFLGRSKNHAGTVGLIRNLNTGKISPQFHVVYDNHFTTVDSVTNLDNVPVPNSFQELLKTSTETTYDPNDIIEMQQNKSKETRSTDESQSKTEGVELPVTENTTN